MIECAIAAWAPLCHIRATSTGIPGSAETGHNDLPVGYITGASFDINGGDLMM